MLIKRDQGNVVLENEKLLSNDIEKIYHTNARREEDDEDEENQSLRNKARGHFLFTDCS